MNPLRTQYFHDPIPRVLTLEGWQGKDFRGKQKRSHIVAAPEKYMVLVLRGKLPRTAGPAHPNFLGKVS